METFGFHVLKRFQAWKPRNSTVDAGLCRKFPNFHVGFPARENGNLLGVMETAKETIGNHPLM